MLFLDSARSRLGLYTCRSCWLRLSNSKSTQSPRRYRSTDSTLPQAPARTRFAPSPTGYLHLGSLRTALFNYLLAKRTGGQFILRIEDTDQKRTVPDAEERLFKDLRWAGLQWDEGPGVEGPYGPYRQSERSKLYRKHAHQLLESGNAYRCFCTPERLHHLAESRHALGLATDYDRTCATIPKDEAADRAARGEAHVVRFRVGDEYPSYTDLVYKIQKPAKQGRTAEQAFEDPILLKSDGLPTYHLANVVDDHHMRITHVIRGLEWMPSTPKHIALYNAFSWTPPQFAHVGLLTDEYGNKLSKRNFDTDIAAFREMEIFPETLTNFAALLGWSHKEKSDVMDLDKLVEKASLHFTKGNTTVTFGKLHFLQRKHAARRAKAGGEGLEEMVRTTVKLVEQPDSPYKELPDFLSVKKRDVKVHDYLRNIILSDAENYTNANEFLYRNSFMLKPLRHDPSAFIDEGDLVKQMKKLEEVNEQDWTKKVIADKIWEVIRARGDEKHQSKEVFHYLRKALTGKEEGMRMYDIMEILGREECLKRLGVEQPKVLPGSLFG